MNDFRGISQCLNPLCKSLVAAAALDGIDLMDYIAGIIRQFL